MDPIAHSSIGLLAKPIAPKAPLVILLAATQVPDILFFALVGLIYLALYGALRRTDKSWMAIATTFG